VSLPENPHTIPVLPDNCKGYYVLKSDYDEAVVGRDHAVKSWTDSSDQINKLQSTLVDVMKTYSDEVETRTQLELNNDHELDKLKSTVAELGAKLIERKKKLTIA
jgi:hypothetical protein